MKVAVVGGGISGLTLAYELSKNGVEVLLLEKNSRTGGQAATVCVDSYQVEKFYHHLFTGDTDFLELVKEISLPGKIVWRQPKMGIHHQEKNSPFGTPWELLKFSSLPLADRLRFGMTTLYLQKNYRQEKWENLSAREWIRKWAGDKVYQVIWGPLLESKFGEKAPEISLAWFGNKIKLRGESRSFWGREKLGYMEGSFQLLIDQLEREIKNRGGTLLVNASVTRISSLKKGRFSLRVLLGENSPANFRSAFSSISQREAVFVVDRVVVTVALPLLVNMVPQLSPDYCHQLAKINYQSNITMLLRLSHSLTSFYWLNISDSRFPFLALIEHTNLIPPDNYGNQHLIYLSRYLSSKEELFHLPGEKILQYYLPFLARINPQFQESWIEEYHVFREEFAQPFITRNYSRQKPSPITPINGLYLANTAQIYPEDRGMNYSIRLAKMVSQLILSRN